ARAHRGGARQGGLRSPGYQPGRQDQQGRGEGVDTGAFCQDRPERGWRHQLRGTAAGGAREARTEGPQRGEKVAMRDTYIFTTVVLLAQSSPASAQVMSDPVALVDFWYRAYLGRPALNDPGSAAWINMLRRGTPPASVLAGILGSREFFNRVGGTMPAFI